MNAEYSEDIGQQQEPDQTAVYQHAYNDDGHRDDHLELRLVKRKLLDSLHKKEKGKSAFIAECASNLPTFILAGLYGEHGHVIASFCGAALASSIIYKMRQQHHEYLVALAIFSEFRERDKEINAMEPGSEKEAAEEKLYDTLKQRVRDNIYIFAGTRKWNLKDNFRTPGIDHEIENYKADLPLTLKGTLHQRKAKGLLRSVLPQNTSRLKENFAETSRFLATSSPKEILSAAHTNYLSLVAKFAKIAGESVESAIYSALGTSTEGQTYKNVIKGYKSATLRRIADKYNSRSELRKFVKKQEEKISNDNSKGILGEQAEVFKHIKDIYFSRSYDLAHMPVKQIAPNAKNLRAREKAEAFQHIVRNKGNSGLYAAGQHITETGFFVAHAMAIHQYIKDDDNLMTVIGTLSALVAMEAFSHFGHNSKDNIKDRHKAREDLLELYKEEHPQPTTEPA